MTTTTNLGMTEVEQSQAQKEVTVNAALETVDKAIAGYEAISVAGSVNVTLTAAQAKNALIKFTGALTGNISVIFPTSSCNKKFVLWNATTGIFSLTVKHAASGVTITQGEKNLIFSDGTDMYAISASGSSSSSASGKNAVINGSFNIWQRGTSFAAIADLAYSADRWIYGKVGTMVHTISRDTDIPTVATNSTYGNYSLRMNLTSNDATISGADQCHITTAIEGFVWTPYAQKDITLSFWVKATTNGTYCVALQNSVPDRTYIAEYTINAANTWEKKTISIPSSPSAGTWNYTTGVGLYLKFTLATSSAFTTTAGSWATGVYLGSSNQINGVNGNTNFRLYQVQLELGTSATVFEPSDFGTELLKCQRYYVKTFPYATAPAQNAGVTAALCHYSQAAVTSGNQWQFPVPMRSAPTITTYNPSAANANWRDATNAADRAVTVATASEREIIISSTAFAAGAQNLIHVAANAEL
jgi:hypothetical protein